MSALQATRFGSNAHREASCILGGGAIAFHGVGSIIYQC